jgi:hypothetical protein
LERNISLFLEIKTTQPDKLKAKSVSEISWIPFPSAYSIKIRNIRSQIYSNNIDLVRGLVSDIKGRQGVWEYSAEVTVETEIVEGQIKQEISELRG